MRIALGSSLLLALLLFALPANAALVVTEIMYNPSGPNDGHQWIEVTNTGSSSLNLGAKYIRLFDGSGNHLIKPYAAGNTELVSNGVAVITQNPLTFLTEYPAYSGLLLKSAFTLAAASGSVGITSTNGTVLAQSMYSSDSGAAGNGNSLQRTLDNSNGVFASAAPTPGVSPVVLPAALITQTKVKQIVSSKSTNKSKQRTSSITSTTTKNHGKGTVAPATSADAAVAGALPDFSIPFPSIPLFASPWFAAFLGLLAFSTFSLILIQRKSYLS